MSDAVAAAIIASVPPTLVALLAVRRVKEVHLALNSRLDEFINVTRTNAHAEGKIEGAQEEKNKT